MAGQYAVGVDFGGTKVLAAVVDLDTGKVVCSSKKRTDASDRASEIGGRLFAAIDDALREIDSSRKKTRITGIGIGIAGQVDSERGVLIGAPNLGQGTANLPLVRMLQDRYKWPAALLNDVQVAAMGEAEYGAGKGTDHFLCVFVGTGVGGAIVHDGVLVRGAAGTAGEIGHLVIHANGRLCGCGGKGHLEAYASRTAMTLAIAADLKRGRESVLTKLAPELIDDSTASGVLRSGLLARAVDDRDQVALDAVTDAATYLGYGLASAINLISPSRVILGGGVVESVPLLFELASARAKAEALSVPGNAVEIVRAALGDHAGVVGAALAGSRAA